MDPNPPHPRLADLNPPLGMPGGSCQVIERIQDNVRRPLDQEKLLSKVEILDDLTNQEARLIYKPSLERGSKHTQFKWVSLTAHAQYRMDLRKITVADIIRALREFHHEWSQEKSRGSTRARIWTEQIQRSEKIRYWASDLQIIFTTAMLRGKGLGAHVITVINNFRPKRVDRSSCGAFDAWRSYVSQRPEAPEAPEAPLRRHALHTTPTPEGETLVGEGFSGGPTMGPGKESSSLPGSTLPGPEPSGEGERYIGGFEYNTPNDDIDRHPRTLSVPGEEWGHPTKYDYNTVTRRTMTGGFDEDENRIIRALVVQWKRRWSPGKRQRKQRGEARQKSRAYYKKNRSKLLMKQRRRRSQNRRRLDSSPRWVSDSALDIAFVVGPENTLGYVDSVSPTTRMVNFWLSQGDTPQLQSLPVEVFLRAATLITDEDIEVFFDLVDTEIGLEAYGTLEEEGLRTCAGLCGEDPDSEEFRAKCLNLIGVGDLSQLSGDQIENLSDILVQGILEGGLGRTASRFRHRSAATIQDILGRTSDDIIQRSAQVPLQRKRFSPSTGFWTFTASGSGGKTYVVRVKGIRKSRIRNLARAQIKCSCTCPAWRWQGPEHWARQNGYLYGRPRGTASLPVVRDPASKHWVCKHIAAAFRRVHSFRFSSESEGWSFDGEVVPMPEPSPERVSKRWVQHLRVSREGEDSDALL